MQPKIEDRNSRIRRLERLSFLLDSAIPLGNTGYRIGLDPIIGLIPGVGDAIGALLSAYIVYESSKIGVSKIVLSRMVFNVMIDFLIGIVPVLGDYFDFTFKANQKNILLLKNALKKINDRGVIEVEPQ